jgi:predicted CoA-binding protein
VRTLILGASDNPVRYSHKAMLMLERYGHEVILVHPSLGHIDNRPVRQHLSEISDPVDTVTMYVNPSISDTLAGDLIALKPRRVIFNPGSENPQLARSLRHAGIVVEEACTLVLLQTGQY